MSEQGDGTPYDLHRTEQLLAQFAEQWPPMWKRMFDNLVKQGFAKEEAMRVLCAYIHGAAGGRLQ